MSVGGAKGRLGCGERSVGVFGSSPPPPWKPRAQMLSQALRNGPGRRSAPSPFPAPPQENWRAWGAWVRWTAPKFKKLAGRRARAIPGRVVWGARWGCSGELMQASNKKPQGRHGLGGFHDATLGACRSECRERPARKTVADADLQSALLMMNTAASSVVVVHEPPAHTSTLHRISAAAAISRTILRMVPSTSDDQDNPSRFPRPVIQLTPLTADSSIQCKRFSPLQISTGALTGFGAWVRWTAVECDASHNPSRPTSIRTVPVRRGQPV